MEPSPQTFILQYEPCTLHISLHLDNMLSHIYIVLFYLKLKNWKVNLPSGTSPLLIHWHATAYATGEAVK
jgi:hypothetical protein